jgi:hypothetical protein
VTVGQGEAVRAEVKGGVLRVPLHISAISEIVRISFAEAAGQGASQGGSRTTQDVAS